MAGAIRGTMRRDWQGQWLKPLFYKNGNRWHFNWGKPLDAIFIAVVVAAVTFLAGRYIDFERDSIAQKQIIQELQKLSWYAYHNYDAIDYLGTCVTTLAEERTRSDRARTLNAIELYNKNKEERRKDLGKLQEKGIGRYDE